VIATFAQGTSTQMDETTAAKAKGVEVDDLSKANAFLTGGLITAATEMPVMDLILKRIPAAEKILKVIPDTFKSPVMEFFGRLTVAAGAEGLQEAAEGFLQRINTQAFIDPEREDYTLDEAVPDAALGAGVGATMQALVYLALHISNRKIPKAINEGVNRTLAKNDIEQAVSAARETKLNTRDPEKMREVLKAGNPDGKTVTLDGTVVQQFFQSDINLEEFYALAPSAQEQFEQAMRAGTDVTIPLDEFLHAVSSAPEATYDFMTDFMKIDPDVDPMLQGWDMKNPEEMNAFIQQAVRQAQEEWQENNEQLQEAALDERIERQIRDNLMNTEVMGEKVRNAETAAAEAAVLGSYIRTRLRKAGTAAERTFNDRFLNETFQVQGYAPPIAKARGTGNARYDTLRRKVKARDAAAKRGDENRKKQTGLFGIGKAKRERSTPTPLINILIARGGVDPKSKIAAELKAAGLTPKSHPRLFTRGKLQDLDNLVASEVESELGTSGVFRADADLNGYIDRNELLDKLRDETFGEYIRSDEQLMQEQIEEAESQFLDALSEMNIDIRTASAEEIDAAIDAYNKRDQQGFEAGPNSYFQSERGAAQFSPGETIIKLFKGADESTLLHEMGHIFLELDAQIAAQPDAPREFQYEFKETLEWLGVESFDQIQTKHHEKFARGFEAYLYEGSAPNSALRNAFERFKLWMTNIYRSIKQLNVPVDDKMRAVFDRLLATDDEIEAVRSDPTIKPDQGTLEMLSPTQQEEYLRRKENAIREAKNKLFRKAYRQAKRMKTAWWGEESDKVQAEVEAELQAQPIYQVIQFIQNGTDFKGDPIASQLESNTYKLDEALVLKAFGGDAQANEELKYMPRGTRSKEGGLDPQIVADMFGFGSAEKLVRAMRNVTPYKQAVQKQTEDRMIERHGDMLNDGTIEAEALAMVMAEDTKAGQIELQALSERTGELYPSDNDFAKAAEIALSRLSVDNAIKPDKYYRAALRAAREYGKALQAKQYEDRQMKGKDGKMITVKGAASWKRQEILNKHLHRLSKQAQEETNKALKRFKLLEKQPAKGNAKAVKIDPDYHQKIWDLLDKYNLQPRLSDAKRLRIELSAINDWIKAKEDDEDASLMMPPELLEADAKQHYRDLSLEQFRAMRDLIYNLETQGRNKRKFIIQGQEKDLANLVEELRVTAEQFNTVIDTGLSERRQRGLFKGMGNLINGIDAINTKTSQVMVKLDGGDNLGLWTRTIYEPIQRAEVEKGVRQREEFKRFRDIMKQHYGDEKSGFLSDVMVEGQTPDTTITREIMLSIALHQGTEDNRTKLLEGYEKSRGWSQEYIDRILSKMRKKDWKFVQSVWAYNDSFWAETSALEKKRFGYPPEKIEPMPFEVTTADGETLQIKGGYMRIMYDGAQDVMAANDEQAQTFKELQIGKNARAQTRRGAMIERVSGVKRPIRLDLDVISEHASEQVAYIHMGEVVDNVSKVLRKKDIQETLQNLIGRDGKEMLDLWLKDVSVGGALSGGKMNKALRTIRSNYTVGRLGLKPMTALLQFSGLSHTIADLGAKRTMIGLGKLFARGNPYSVSKDIAAKSQFMAERRFAINRDIADAITYYATNGKYVSQKTAAVLLYPMQKTQEIVDGATWLAAYDKATADGLDDADAIRAADIAVARLQASGLISDLAAIERGTLGTSTQRQELVKATTMFFSYFNAKYNLLKNKNIQYKNKQIGAVDLAGSYLMALLVEGTISAAIMGQIDWDADDDDELSAQELAYGISSTTLYNAASTVPFLRTIGGGTAGFSGETAAGGQLAGLGEFAARLGGLGTGVGELLVTGESQRLEKENVYSLTRKSVDALNTFVPLPASTINQFIRGMERQEKTGEATPLDYFIYREDRF
jgi:GH24 family phage-related lysozyme (muramidase)